MFIATIFIGLTPLLSYREKVDRCIYLPSLTFLTTSSFPPPGSPRMIMVFICSMNLLADGTENCYK